MGAIEKSVCENCRLRPGGVIKVDNKGNCVECGLFICEMPCESPRYQSAKTAGVDRAVCLCDYRESDGACHVGCPMRSPENLSGPQKPTAEAGLVAELQKWANHYFPGQGGLRDSDLQDILSRYEAVPVKEGGDESLEEWENEAEAFYKVTGCLRPGKDPGIIGDEGYCQKRDKAWAVWCGGWNYRASLHPRPSADKGKAKGE